MNNKLKDIAQQLIDANKKIQLIYAFNGTGKTRLSREFKNLIAPKITGAGDEPELSRNKILYYNAFTEDLFYWDNDLEADKEPILKIQPNTFTGWLMTLLQELGEDGNIVTNFQRYTACKATPTFNEAYTRRIKNDDGKDIEIKIPAFSEVAFLAPIQNVNVPIGVDPLSIIETDVVQGQYEKTKISKGEESNFVWTIIYTLLEQVISTLNEPNEANRITDKFNQLEYVFIDDPVSSLDDTHLIELAVDLARLIKISDYREGRGLRFVITTHSPLFYNVLHNELNNDLKNPIPNGIPTWLYKRNQSEKYRLEKQADGNFKLVTSTDRPFSYHLFLLSEVRKAINEQQIGKYHFSLLRNILEKTATFLGYPRWEDLLEKTNEGLPNPFASRIMNLSSHSAHAGEEVSVIEEKDKEHLNELVNHLIQTYRFNSQDAQ